MALTTSFGRKAAAAALAVLTLGAGLSLGAGQAEARDDRKGALIAAGVIGAIATTAIIAGAQNAHAAPAYHDAPDYGYTPAPAYGVPQPVYYGERPVYEYNRPVHPGYYRPPVRRYHGYSETGFSYRGPACKLRKERVWDGYGWRVHRYQVCR